MTICFFNDTATTEIYTLSLHDALPIYRPGAPRERVAMDARPTSDHHVPKHEAAHSSRCPRRTPARRPRDGCKRPTSDRKSTRLNSSHANISYAVFCLKKKPPSNLLLTL